MPTSLSRSCLSAAEGGQSGNTLALVPAPESRSQTGSGVVAVGQASDAPPAWALSLLQATQATQISQDIQVAQGVKHEGALAKLTELVAATAQHASTAVQHASTAIVEIQEIKVCCHVQFACRSLQACSVTADTALWTCHHSDVCLCAGWFKHHTLLVCCLHAEHALPEGYGNDTLVLAALAYRPCPVLPCPE